MRTTHAERTTLSLLFQADEVLPEAGECRVQQSALTGVSYAIIIHAIKRRYQNSDGEWIVEAACTRYPVTAARRKQEEAS